MRILLTEGSSTSARQAITALALAGHEVAYCDPEPFCLGRFSRLVAQSHRCPPLGTDPEGFRATLRGLLAQGGTDVLLPIHEQGYLVARVAAELGRHAALALPAFAAYARVQTKLGFGDLLTELGLSQPRTRLLDDPRGLLRHDTPFVAKMALGTASRGTWLIRSAADRDQAIAEIAQLPAGAGPVLVQDWVNAPLEQAQAVFQQGRLVGFHATRRLIEGGGGGAALKESVRRPRIAKDLARLGAHLSWHGALSVDYFIDGSGEHPLYIDGNPRLVEPMAATLAGLNLADLLVQVSAGRPIAACLTGEPGIRTRLSLQAILGTALRTGRRRAVLGTIAQLARAAGPFAGAREELTPIGRDPASALPLLGLAAALLASPRAAPALVRRGWGAHLLTPEAMRRIEAMA
ncbi:ATP-grasp domain-containing protein [Methylobacterium oryzisoli]|uniref:ATP-grasp domain-containing protein n=1 Tax=Methylobacterium oryzisoli TaxID=3385502 RepID=UPI0038927755